MGSIPDRQALAEVTEAPTGGSSAGDAIDTPFYPATEAVPASSGQDTIPIDNNPIEIDIPIPLTVSTMYLVQVMFLAAVGTAPLSGGVGAYLVLATCYRDSAGVLRAPAVSAVALQSESGGPALLSITPSILGANEFRLAFETTNVGHNQVAYRYTMHEQPWGFDLPTPS